MSVTRGTTNTNVRGNVRDRRSRKLWLLTTFGDGTKVACYRCEVMLDHASLTVDRILPGCMGGTYVRGNIRPCCMGCNIATGNEARETLRAITNWTAPRHKRGCRHCAMVRDYRLARHSAELQREAVTGAYASELAEYGQIITFKQWLTDTRGVNDQLEEVPT